jgi:hypothetical protein
MLHTLLVAVECVQLGQPMVVLLEFLSWLTAEHRCQSVGPTTQYFRCK